MGVVWKTIKRKYDDIAERFQNAYPRADSGVSSEDFPNCENPKAIGKERIIPQVKRIKTAFRKAVNSGCKSGGGRVIADLYNEYQEIWGGSPAVKSFAAGMESSLLGHDTAESIDNSTSQDSVCDLSDSNDDS